MKKEVINITGMTCSACSSRIEKTVSELNGVQKADVNLLTNKMMLEYNEKSISLEKVIEAIEKIGYGVSYDGLKKEKKKDDHLRRLILSILFTIPLFYLAMGHKLTSHFQIYLKEEKMLLFWHLPSSCYYFLFFLSIVSFIRMDGRLLFTGHLIWIL